MEDNLEDAAEEQYLSVTRRELAQICFNDPSKNIDTKFNHLIQQMMRKTNCSEKDSQRLKNQLHKFKFALKKNYERAQRKMDRLLNDPKCQEWLSGELKFLVYGNRRSGRPSIPFEQSSERSKRRKTEKTRASMTAEELSFAAQMNYRKDGKQDQSTVIKEITTTTPTRARKYREAFKARSWSQASLSGDEALSILVEAQLTVHQYNIIRKADPSRFPSYKIVAMSKKMCYPNEDSISVSEQEAQVKLQNVLDHTASRIAKLQQEVLIELPISIKNLVLICKWGCDGSSGHTEYKQKALDPNASDASMFVVSFVPLQLYCEETRKVVVWQNCRPSSSRFCRPIRIKFQHETDNLTREEVASIETEISSLNSCGVTVGDRNFNVKYLLSFTMVDSKVCNAVTSTKSAMRCYLCNATSSHFNNVDDMLSRNINEEHLKFGMSILHAWIRMFECLIHIAYKLKVKKWRCNPEENKIVEETKKIIQQKFKQQLGLIVDKPKQNFGNSNDGNTARRFFENASVSSEITQIDENLIKKFHIILQVISCGHAISEEKFREFCVATARYYVHLYPWYSMPTTIHKILIHGPSIVRHAILPIGQISEEAQEARNRHLKLYREYYARKCSREKTLRDVFNRLMVTSDPYISGLRELPKKKIKKLMPEVISMLEAPEIHFSDSETAKSDDDSEDDS